MGKAHPQIEFTDLLAEVPDSTESAKAARRERARTWARLRCEKGAAEFEERIEWADYYEALGKAQRDNDDYRAAIESFERAMAIEPFRTRLREDVLDCYFSLQDFDSAKDLSLDILRDDPTDASAHVSLAQCYLAADPNDTIAEKLLMRSIELKPASFVAHDSLAGMALEAGRVDDALAHYSAVLQLWPDFAWFHYFRVTIYLESCLYAEASQAFTEMLEKVAPSDPEAANLLDELKAFFSMSP